MSSLSSANNELAEKLNKLAETVYSGLPAVNSINDEIIDLKKARADLDKKFERTANTTNSLVVETNGLSLKLESMAKEFQNIQKAVSDTQSHILEFINLARTSINTLSNYNPEEIKSAVKASQDRIDALSKELDRTTESQSSLSKQMSAVSSKISELGTVKNAAKLFDSVQDLYKAMEETQNKMNVQASKVEIMFNEITSSLNKFSALNKNISDLSKRENDFENEINKLKAALPSFATKDEIVEIQNKLNSLGSK